MNPRTSLLVVFFGVLLCPTIATADDPNSVYSSAPQWQQVEIEFYAAQRYSNAYVECQAWVDFVHEDGTEIRRPMFWDGGQTFRVRFASTKSQGVWRWTSVSEPDDAGLKGLSGTIRASPNRDGKTIFDRHGFWRIPSGQLRYFLSVSKRSRVVNHSYGLICDIGPACRVADDIPILVF